MKKKLLTLGISGVGFLLLCCPLYFFLGLPINNQVSVPLEKLLAESLSFPTEWGTGEIPVQGVNWQISETDTTILSDRGLQPVSAISRRWTHNGMEVNNPAITQHIFLYDYPEIAAFQYKRFPPESRYSLPGFDFRGDDSDIHPSTWTYQSNIADQEYVVCGLGGTEACQAWFYWAQYGQYILQVRFFAPNQGIDAKTFAHIVEQVDTHITGQLTQ